MNRKVVLYNPRAVFWTMPLALIAVGSALDRSKYQVLVVDGRLEADPVGTLLAHLDDHAVCLGITVLTGAPIRDALTVSRAVKAAKPHLPIIWGGWHPSIFPLQCLAEPSVDAAVIGQGELTFRDIVEQCARSEPPEGIPGCAFTAASRGAAVNPARPFADVNSLPAHDYQLVAVERYFELKGRRQFDFVSSQGCRFRCSFCADPTVFKRGWYGLAPERVAHELAAHHRTYGFAEVSFQDETFFTSSARVAAIAEAMLNQGLRVEWTATMRSDQGSRLDEAVLVLCKRSGLRRVMFGVESGAPETLKRIQKDITIEQVYESAAKCARHGIGAILNFIVGFPGESDESVSQTLEVAARLRAMSPDFEVSIFYFMPYPGTPLADEALHGGYRFAETLEGWSDFDYIAGRERWVTQARWKQIERFKFYQRYAFGREKSLLRRPLRALSRWRIDNHMYGFPLEKFVVDNLRPAPRQS